MQEEKEEADLDTTLLEKSIDTLEKKKTRLYEKYREGDLSRDEYISERDMLNARIDEMKATIQGIEAKRMLKQSDNSRIDLLSELIHQYKDSKNLTKELERIFVEQVLVYDAEHITIKWKFDDVFQAIHGCE